MFEGPRRGLKRYWVIVTSAIILIAIIALLSLYQHRRNEQVLLSYFQEQQLLHAQHIADEIQTLLWSYQRILQVLPSFPAGLTEDIGYVKADIQTYARHIQEDYVHEITLYDKNGLILYPTDPSATGVRKDRSRQYLWAQQRENMDKILAVPLIRDEEIRQFLARPESGGSEHSSSNFMVFLAIPVYRQVHPGRLDPEGRRFAGLLSFLIDLKKFLAVESQHHKMRDHSFWIMDRDGELLFSSGHPEMVLRNFRQRDQTCAQCHSSFDYAEKILQRGEGTIDYRVKNAPRKLAGFARVTFADLSWVVTVDSPYDTVSAVTGTSLRHTALYLAIVVLSFLLGSAYLVHSERMRVKAQKESQHALELSAERRKSEEILKSSEEQLRYLSARLLTTQEEERGRISKDLHDGLGGALATLKLRENLLKRALGKDQVDLIKECEVTIDYIDQTMEEVRRLLRNLTPSVLEHLGLSAALQWLADDHSTRNNTKVEMNGFDVNRSLSREAEITIFRIFQEALRNAEKYAHAAHVSVAVEETGDAFCFSIHDDGKGFDLSQVSSRSITEKGLGLAIMEERARMLGGSLKIWSEPGKGTRISFRIPKEERKVES